MSLRRVLALGFAYCRVYAVICASSGRCEQHGNINWVLRSRLHLAAQHRLRLTIRVSKPQVAAQELPDDSAAYKGGQAPVADNGDLAHDMEMMKAPVPP